MPSFEERLLGTRNRNWMRQIVRDLESGHTYFVVDGAGRIGGPNGLLALLRARDYQIEQF
ncbi:MAG: TraB/GumN family protein [Chthoniobacterales bacterium]